MTAHTQTLLRMEFGPLAVEAEVDDGLTRLIAACWAAGWPTKSSCQSQTHPAGDHGWIAFANPLAARRFLDLAQSEGIEVGIMFAHDITDENHAEASDDTDYGYDDDTTTVLFPPADIDRLTALIEGDR